MIEKSIEMQIGDVLSSRGLMLATAESCTGGLIGQRITDVAGSSGYYAGGVIAYSNAVKIELLGVGEDVLEKSGAVSEPVAEAMAAGVLNRLNADIAVSTTGIAGPGGGTKEKPVGLVYVGLAAGILGEANMRERGGGTPAPENLNGLILPRDRMYITVRECRFEGNRREVRMAASQTAFEMIQQHLDSYENH